MVTFRGDGWKLAVVIGPRNHDSPRHILRSALDLRTYRSWRHLSSDGVSGGSGFGFLSKFEIHFDGES